MSKLFSLSLYHTSLFPLWISILFIDFKSILEKSITAEYLLSYILPLLAFDFTRWDQTVLFLIFYMTLGFLCIRHNFFSVNIMPELSQFKFYNCELVNEDGRKTKQTVISKRQLSECLGETIYLRSLNNEYKLDVKK